MEELMEYQIHDGGMGSDTYICDFCGTEMKWYEKSETHGEIWPCEECGKMFCSKCLKDKVGEAEYLKVMQSLSSEYEDDILRCPSCVRRKQIPESFDQVVHRLIDGLNYTDKQQEEIKKWLLEYQAENRLSLKQLDDFCFGNTDFIFSEVFK